MGGPPPRLWAVAPQLMGGCPPTDRACFITLVSTRRRPCRGYDPSVSYYAVATILNPRLRLDWFKQHWRKHDLWHKKAESSMKEIFQRYVDAEEQEEPEPTEIVRRKQPASGDLAST